MNKRKWLRVRKKSRDFSATVGITYWKERNFGLVDEDDAYKAMFWEIRYGGWLVLEGEDRSARMRSSKRSGWLMSVRHNGGKWNCADKFSSRKEAKLQAIAWVWGS